MTDLFIVKRNKRGRFALPGTRKTVTMWDLPPGAMWRCTCHGEKGWLIQLPDGNPWCTLLGSEQGKGWEVTGEAPKLTVRPSIDHVRSGGWHGTITNGQMNEGEFHP